MEVEVLEAAEEARHLPAVRASEAIVARGELTVDELVAQADKIQQVMAAVMKDGVHYGKVPGVNKPTLLKPGAELLNVLLRLAPSYESEKVFHDDGHLTVISKCTLTHIPTGFVIAEGEGLCTTRESKYAYRQGKRRCPDCNAEAIVRSTKKKAFFCISNEGGCGNRFAFDTDKARQLEQQDTSKVPNPDLPDQWNTVIKMADKRALVAATLNGTGASDVFTQDAEENSGGSFSRGNAQPEPEPQPEPEREFDPGVDLLEGAVTATGDFQSELQGRMMHLDPTLDWGAVIKQAWPGKTSKEFWLRLSNCLEWIYRVSSAQEGDFPPVAPDTIVAGFAWAFNGVVVEPVARNEDAANESSSQD